jgi:hypothetical protein
MCFVRISEQTATFGLQNIKILVFITEKKSVTAQYALSPCIKHTRFVFKGLKQTEDLNKDLYALLVSAFINLVQES